MAWFLPGSQLHQTPWRDSKGEVSDHIPLGSAAGGVARRRPAAQRAHSLATGSLNGSQDGPFRIPPDELGDQRA